MIMNKTLNWLYEHWMKGTPFLALYTFVLIWLYVRGNDYGYIQSVGAMAPAMCEEYNARGLTLLPGLK